MFSTASSTLNPRLTLIDGQPRFRQTLLVAAAGAAPAAGRVLVPLGAFLHLEGVPAAARRADVRVVDLEAGLLEAVDEVDGRALQVRRAERVDDDGDAVHLDLVVALLR